MTFLPVDLPADFFAAAGAFAGDLGALAADDLALDLAMIWRDVFNEKVLTPGGGHETRSQAAG